MLFKTAIRIILYEKTKFAGAVAGVGLAIFLVLLQWGFYFGYRRDTTVVLNAFDADLWIVPKGQVTFDGFATLDEAAYYKARDLPEIEKDWRVVWGVAPFRHCLNGSAQRVQVLGVEFESGIRVNLQTAHRDLASALRPDGCVLVGRRAGGNSASTRPVAEGAEIRGRRADRGRLRRQHPSIHHLGLCGDRPGQRPAVPWAFFFSGDLHCLQVPRRCRRASGRPATAAGGSRGRRADHAGVQRLDVYNWETKTGIGPLMLFPSVLAGLAGFSMVTLTFYISTIQKLPLYASLKAIGASNSELVSLLLVQVFSVFVLGAALAAAACGRYWRCCGRGRLPW